MDNNTVQTLLDFVVTTREDNFNVDVTLTKFPQLQQVDRQTLLDFVATARANNYDMDLTLVSFLRSLV